MIAIFSIELYTTEYKKYADDIGFYVQHIGGEFAVTRNNVEFTVPLKYKDFVLIQYPFLKEIPLVY